MAGAAGEDALPPAVADDPERNSAKDRMAEENSFIKLLR
jgi:hypothetical protein